MGSGEESCVMELMLTRYEDVERLLADGWTLASNSGDTAHHGHLSVLLRRDLVL